MCVGGGGGGGEEEEKEEMKTVVSGDCSMQKVSSMLHFPILNMSHLSISFSHLI